MKYILMPLLLCMLYCKSNDKIEKIEIRKMEFGWLGVIPIECSQFDKEIDVIDTFIITTPNEISLIQESIKSASQAPKGYDGIDTRGKVIIHYQSGKKDSFCVGTTVMFYYHNKTMEFKDGSVVRFIDSLPMKEEW